MDKKLDFFFRFYQPKTMFSKRKYKWWQNCISILIFAMFLSTAAFSFLTRPKYYYRLVENKLSYYTKHAQNKEFQKAVAAAKFKNCKLYYSGKKKIRVPQKFDLGINLTARDITNARSTASLVFTSKDIFLYAQNTSSKKYKIDQVSFPYGPRFNNRSKHLDREIVRSWITANTKDYRRAVIVSWFFDFIFRILLIWLIMIVIVRSVIRKINHKNETLVNLFGMMVNASVIPIGIITIIGYFYFNPLILTLLFGTILGLIIIWIWRKTSFTDGLAEIKG